MRLSLKMIRMLAVIWIVAVTVVLPAGTMHAAPPAIDQCEAKARELKREIVALTTKLTARPFYLAQGYELMDEEEGDDGLGFDAVVQMSKRLV